MKLRLLSHTSSAAGVVENATSFHEFIIAWFGGGIFSSASTLATRLVESADTAMNQKFTTKSP